MTDNGLHIIFERGACLTREQMLAYIKGDLQDKERYLFEKHLNACALCSDEFEGLQEMHRVEQLPEIIDSLNNEIDKRLIFKPKTIRNKQKFFLRMAAVFLLLIGSVYFIQFYYAGIHKDYAVQEEINYEPYGLNENEIVTENEDVVSLPEHKVSKQIISEHVQKNNKHKLHKKITSQEKEQANKQIVAVANDEFVEDAGNDEFIVEEVDTEAETDVNTVIEAKKTEFEEFTDKTLDKEKKIKANQKVNSNRAKMISSGYQKALIISDLDSGIKAYHKKNYQQALVYLKAAENKKDSLRKVRYYLGLNYFALKEYNKAQKQFDKLLQDSTAVYYPDALWQKALLLIAKNKPKQAQKILFKLAQSSSKYKKEAAAKIDSLSIH